MRMAVAAVAAGEGEMVLRSDLSELVAAFKTEGSEAVEAR